MQTKMPPAKLVIIGDPSTGQLQMQGPIKNAMLMHFLLGEARRVFERDMNKAENSGPNIIIPKLVPPNA